MADAAKASSSKEELREKDKRERDELHERIMEKERQSKKRTPGTASADKEKEQGGKDLLKS